MTVSVRSAWWPALVLLALPLLMLLPLLVPEEDRELGNGGILLFSLATAVLLGGILGVTYRVRGSEAFTADDTGLHLHSSKRGDRTVRWDELIEIGWVRPTRYTRGGLAGRRQGGGEYEPGGHNIAGWLSQPNGVVQPSQALRDLESLSQQHGVAWRTYAPAEVM